MSGRIRIAVADDHEAFRKSVVTFLAVQTDLEVIGQASSAEEAVALALKTHPDLVILDVNMPGGGVRAAETLRSVCPRAKIVMLSQSDEEEYVRGAFANGVAGYVLKGIAGKELAKVLRHIHAGGRYVDPSVAHLVD